MATLTPQTLNSNMTSTYHPLATFSDFRDQLSRGEMAKFAEIRLFWGRICILGEGGWLGLPS